MVLKEASGWSHEREKTEGYGPAEELARTRFRNAKDPRIKLWAIDAVEKAGGDITKVKIVACVPVENAKEWELNKEIRQAMIEQLKELGVDEKNIYVFVEAMDFGILSELITQQNWKKVQSRLAYATDENGVSIVKSEQTSSQWNALANAKTYEEFKQALFSLGKTPVFFPEMEKDDVVTALYDEMRKATIRREQKKLENPPQIVANERKPAVPEIKVPEPNPVIPTPQIYESKIPKIQGQVPTDWADFNVRVPFSNRSVGNGSQPSITRLNINMPDADNALRNGGLTKEQKKEAYRLKNINSTLGFVKPMWNPMQALEFANSYRNGGGVGIILNTFHDTYWHKMSEFGFKTIDEVFKASKQWEFYKKWENDELSIFGSLPLAATPIALTIPGMRGMDARIYNGIALGVEYSRRVMLPKIMQDELFKGSVELEIGYEQIFSKNKLFGARKVDENDPIMAQIYKSIFSNPMATDKKLGIATTTFGDDMQSLDALDTHIPVPKFNVKVDYRYEPAGKNIWADINLTMRPLSIAAGKWPTTTFNFDSYAQVFRSTMGEVFAGISTGFNANAMNLDHIRGELKYDPKIKGLPALTASYEYSVPLVGPLNTLGLRAEGELGDLLGIGQMGYFFQWYKTMFPYGNQSVNSLQFGIRVSGKIPIAWEEL